jgi:hypothetical protein
MPAIHPYRIPSVGLLLRAAIVLAAFSTLGLAGCGMHDASTAPRAQAMGSQASDACTEGWLAAKAWECLSGGRIGLRPVSGTL